MLRFVLRSVTYLLVIVLCVGAVGGFGLLFSQKDFWANYRQEPLPSLQGLEKPQHDPQKPTVAILLGNESTEGLDFTIPYQLFSMTGAYNVYAVAADNQVKTLTGGLEIVPHYSFAELDELLGKSADIITIPYMTMFDSASYVPVKNWILQHQDTTLLSICAGAENLAVTGLLDGKTSATHWQTMPVLTKNYPQVNWVQNQRYVTNNNGKIVTSAGISSGIDAVLYVISKKLGEPVAENIAKELHYPSYQFVKNPTVEPFAMDIRYSTYMLNNAFQWNKNQVGILLYNGVEEMAVASVFDIYSDTGTAKVLSVTQTDQPIVTKYGLHLIARHNMSSPPAVDKMIVPGTQANTLAVEEAKIWQEKGNGQPLRYVHNDPNRFIFELMLEDLAKQEDLLTAQHAVKRLEFRANDFHLEGNPIPFETYGVFLITLAGAILIAVFVDKWIFRRKIAKHGVQHST